VWHEHWYQARAAFSHTITKTIIVWYEQYYSVTRTQLGLFALKTGMGNVTHISLLEKYMGSFECIQGSFESTQGSLHWRQEWVMIHTCVTLLIPVLNAKSPMCSQKSLVCTQKSPIKETTLPIPVFNAKSSMCSQKSYMNHFWEHIGLFAFKTGMGNVVSFIGLFCKRDL